MWPRRGNLVSGMGLVGPILKGVWVASESVVALWVKFPRERVI